MENHAKHHQKFPKFGYFEYPEIVNELAPLIGQIRRSKNDKLYNEVPSKKRGEHDNNVHSLGIKGELAVAFWLWRLDIKHEQCNLISDNPIVGYDFLVESTGVEATGIDVKTLRSDGWDLLVTCKSFRNYEKNIDAYLFLQNVTDIKMRYWYYTKEEVGKWKIKNTLYNDNYYKPISETL